MNNGILDYLLKLFNYNNNIKKYENECLDNFEKIYNFVNTYDQQDITYDEMIHNSEARLRFLSNAINIVINNEDIDESTREVAEKMIYELIEYLANGSRLEDIEIPQVLKDKMIVQTETKKGKQSQKRHLMVPTSKIELDFLFNLIRENKRIYDEELKGMDLSVEISEGLHQNIKELLSIEEKDVSHMLGVNNDAHHLFDFYRKETIEYECSEIGTPGIEEFNLKFFEKYGLEYNQENYNKLICLRYNQIEKMKENGEIDDVQENKLKQSFARAPKSKAIDFYSFDGISRIVSHECVKNADFVYSYIKNNLADQLRSKRKNELLEKYAQNDINSNKKIIALKDELKELSIAGTLDKKEKNRINSEIQRIKESEIFCSEKYQKFISMILDDKLNPNDNNLRLLIDDYISIVGNSLEKNKDFQSKFKNNFGYEYPLIDYYEILTKNISFYNFSLLKNLNSIIVDFSIPKTNKLSDSDVFLISYAKKKREQIEKRINKMLNNEKQSIETQVKSFDSNTTDDYIAALKSLQFFPEDDRYYFRQSFQYENQNKNNSSRDRDCKVISSFKHHYEQEEGIMNDAEQSGKTKGNDIFSIMGFSTSKEERERIDLLSTATDEKVIHKHFWNTNVSSNFKRYRNHFLKHGQEYPIGIVAIEDPAKKKIRVKSINDTGPNGLLTYIELFNNYNNNLNNGYQRSLKYERYLIDTINSIIDAYDKLLKSKIQLLEYTKSKYAFNQNDIDKYDSLINKEILNLENFEQYYERTKYYFKEYEKIFEKSMNEIQFNQEQSSKKRK